MAYPALELFRDVVLLTLVLVNWICTSAIADAVTEDVAARRACAVYIAVFACVVNVYSFQRSWTKLGKPDAPRESILGLFAQVCNLTQVWGALFAAARYFFLPEDNLFFTTSLMHAQAESLFEMSLVQSGTGWAAAVPTTVAERIVAWAAAYIGGVMCTNMFLLSVVLSRRGYWQTTVPPATPTPATALLALRR
tara:strand:- start:204 stop:785 length:582 start_codon:yes stop_codon:yes gene_type:complete